MEFSSTYVFVHYFDSQPLILGGCRGRGGGEVTSEASGIWKGRDFIRLAKKFDLKSFTFSAESKQTNLLRLSQKSASGASFLEYMKG